MELNFAHRFHLTCAFLLLCLVLCSGSSVSITHVRRLFSTPSSSDAVCRIERDFSSIAATLRTYILTAQREAAAEVLSGNQTFSFGAGLTFTKGQECAVRRTENRRRDPDIVAIQAIALSAQSNREAEKLANAIVLSFESSCKCSLFSPQEKDRMAGVFRGFLEDKEVIQSILDFGGSVTRERPFRTSAIVSGRRLLSGRPDYAFVCRFCEPSHICKPACNWC